MFNEVRIFHGQPVRLWSRDRDGRFAIYADGLMRWFHNSEIEKMAVAANDAGAFPAQDARPAEAM